MSQVPSLDYTEIVSALQRGGWRTVRQRGSHVRLERTIELETLRITVPAHKPVKRSTLAHILKQARLDVNDFLRLL